MFNICGTSKSPTIDKIRDLKKVIECHLSKFKASSKRVV